MSSPAPILLLSGPPGAGKTTTARRLAETSDVPAVHLHTDDFYAAIRTGYILPWLAESHDQNATVTRAIVAAAGAYAAGGYRVIVDGVIGPWFLDPYRAEAARVGAALDYVVLRADRETVAARARDRADAPLADYPPTIFEEFADLGPREHHAIDSGGVSIEELAAKVLAAQSSGTFRVA